MGLTNHKESYGLWPSALAITVCLVIFLLLADFISEPIDPAAGSAYLDRADVRPGMIIPGQTIHAAFTSRGWTWGGSWNSVKDYHHFEKSLPVPAH